MAKGVAITEDIYEQIKAAFIRGASGRDIAKVFCVSEGTVSAIRTTDNIEEYRQKIAKWSGFQKSKEDRESENTISIQTFYYNMNRIYEELKKQTELLQRITEQWQ